MDDVNRLFISLLAMVVPIACATAAAPNPVILPLWSGTPPNAQPAGQPEDKGAQHGPAPAAPGERECHCVSPIPGSGGALRGKLVASDPSVTSGGTTPGVFTPGPTTAG